MKRFNVTIPFKKRPFLKALRVKADSKQQAIDNVLQSVRADPDLKDQPFKRPQAKECL